MRHHTTCVKLNAYSRATKAKNGQHKKYGLVLKLEIRKSSYRDLELNHQVLGAVHGVVTKFLILPTYSMQRKRLNDGA
jgi:hypothetical protein